MLLFIWHRFIQPYVLRYWNPWAVKDADGNVVTKPEDTKFPIDCSGGQCVFLKNKKNSSTDNGKASTGAPQDSGEQLVKETGANENANNKKDD